MPRLRALSLCIALAPSLLLAQDAPQSIKDALKRADAEIAKIIAIPDSQRTFDNTLGALDAISARLDIETSLAAFMFYVSTNADERDAGTQADEAVTNWAIELGKREDLYNAIKAFADTNPKLEGEQKRLLDFTMRDYRRAGMALPSEQREKLQALEIELNKLGNEFQKNINEDQTTIPVFESELKGLPKGVLDRQTKSAGMVLLRLNGPTYSAVMDFCEDPLTRQKCWTMYRRRAGTKNVALIEKIVKIRAEISALLGYKNTVDYEIETRMAKNSETVAKFYAELEPLVRKKAEADMAELLAFKRKHTKDKEAVFNPWDYAYYKELLKREKYSVDSEKIAEYFPMDQVVQGLFNVAQSSFGLKMTDVTADASRLDLPIWHEDVKLYEIKDAATGELLGHLYTDLFPRENKYTHAACWGLRPRKVWADGTVQRPLAALVCNFTKPTADKPSLLPHDEVETFFHEFGHGLHQILTETKYARFSGTAVARDFVEAPSQMLEEWIWKPEVLKTFAKHYKTREPLPQKTLEAMVRGRNFGSGIEIQGQLFLGALDQSYHTDPSGVIDSTALGQQAYEKMTLYKSVPGTYFQAAFGHLVGYEGAYYGYLWALVYAQDLFTRFEKEGVLNPEAGMFYRKNVLAKGGTMDEMEMLRSYLGREPNMDAFLKMLGMTRGD